MKKTVISAALSLGIGAVSLAANSAPLKIDVSKTTVSGLSSGGYMATQFHLSHAEWVQGIGVKRE